MLHGWFSIANKENDSIMSVCVIVTQVLSCNQIIEIHQYSGQP